MITTLIGALTSILSALLLMGIWVFLFAAIGQ